MPDGRERFPIPNPDQLGRFLDDIRHHADVIEREYRWLQPDAYRGPKHGESDKVSGGEHRDLAGTVGNTDRFRTHLRHAAREVLDAANRLAGAVADLNDAAKLLNPPPGPEVADVRLLPRPADRGDVERAREAQARRQVRAVASGDWGEVTG